MADVDWAGFTQLQQQNNQIANPMQRFAQGFQIGALMRQQNANNQAKEQETLARQQLADRQNALQAELESISTVTDPMQRVQSINNIMLKFPEVADKLKTQATFYSDEVKNNTSNMLLPALNALNLGNKDVAIERLTVARDAFKNGGNKRGAEALDSYISDIQSTKDVAPLVQTGYLTLASIIGPDKVMETLSKSQDYAKTQAVMPSEIGKVQSEATIKAEEAKRAPLETSIKAEEAIRAPLETQIKQADASIAQDKAKLELEQARASLELTKQQKLVAVANAKKINNEIEQLSKDVASGKLNIADPEKRFDFEKKLRDEYKSNTTDFVKTRDAYDRMSSIYSSYLKPDKDGKVTIPKGETKQTADARQAAGDIGLIFNYMKMLDPGSTVREGEFATAANAAGVTDQVRNIYNKIASGERLTPQQRGAYFNQAKGLYEKSKSRADEVEKSLSVVVDSYGLNKDNVFSKPKGTVRKVN